MPIGDRIRAVCFAVTFPFFLVLIFVMPRPYAMITDSVPDHSTMIRALLFAMTGIAAVLNWRFLFYNGQAMHVAAVSFGIGAISISWNGPNFYQGVYQKIMFENSVSYERIVKIRGLAHNHRRGGGDYFAFINPYNIISINPQIHIEKDLFNIAREAIVRDETKPSRDQSGCSIRVTVDKAGSAERIRWDRPLNQSAIVSCDGRVA